MTAAERWELLRIARASVSAAALGFSSASVAPTLPAALSRRTGAFVTLRLAGALRGCIGRTDSEDRLADVVTAMARAAALRDPRFTPVRPQEVNGLRIEISVLGPLLPCAPDEVVVGRDGLVVDGLGRRGLLLPEVASDQGWDREAFIRETCRKAGLPSAALDRGARLFSFRTEHFAESP